MSEAGFRWPVRVYYEDTDAGGIVYHTNYLKYLERARTEWLRSRGWAQRELARQQGIIFSVVSLTTRYRRPARLDDELEVSCETRRDGGASLAFEQHIWRLAAGARELLIDAEVRVACVDAATLKPRRLPANLIEDLS